MAGVARTDAQILRPNWFRPQVLRIATGWGGRIAATVSGNAPPEPWHRRCELGM